MTFLYPSKKDCRCSTNPNLYPAQSPFSYSTTSLYSNPWNFQCSSSQIKNRWNSFAAICPKTAITTGNSTTTSKLKTGTYFSNLSYSLKSGVAKWSDCETAILAFYSIVASNSLLWYFGLAKDASSNSISTCLFSIPHATNLCNFFKTTSQKHM